MLDFVSVLTTSWRRNSCNNIWTLLTMNVTNSCERSFSNKGFWSCHLASMHSTRYALVIACKTINPSPITKLDSYQEVLKVVSHGYYNIFQIGKWVTKKLVFKISYWQTWCRNLWWQFQSWTLTDLVTWHSWIFYSRCEVTNVAHWNKNSNKKEK